MSAQGQDKGDSSTNILWIIALVFLAIIIIWYNFSNQLKAAFLMVRFVEAYLIYFILNLASMGDDVLEMISALNSVRQTPEVLNADLAAAFSAGVGDYLKYPVAVILVFLGLSYWLKNIQVKFKNIYDMRRLSTSQQVLWPQICPVTQLDLIEEDVDVGPWAMAMTPIQYCKKNKLVKMVIIPPSPLSLSKELKFKITLLPQRADHVLGAQLGRAWHGVDKMPPHRRAIFAIFAARGCRDTKAAVALMAQLASSSTHKLDCTGADLLWQKHYKNKGVTEICGRHAYELTVMASMLLFARDDGVVASADYLWVKPLDRRLWYVLNTVGRQTPPVEVAGIFAHWITENALKRPLSVPQIKEATKALDLALSEMIYTPDEAERKIIIAENDKMMAEGEASSP